MVTSCVVTRHCLSRHWGPEVPKPYLMASLPLQFPLLGSYPFVIAMSCLPRSKGGDAHLEGQGPQPGSPSATVAAVCPAAPMCGS